MTSIGKVEELSREFNFEWKINDFFALPYERGETYSSPLFSFAGVSWFILIFPNGETIHNSVGYISLLLCRPLSGSPIKLRWTWGLRASNGKKENENRLECVFEGTEGYGSYGLCQRTMLFEKKSELVPSDILTIVCTIEHYSKSTDGIATTKCPQCKDMVEDKDILAHQEKCLIRPVKCPKCSCVVALKNWHDHECQLFKSKEEESLIQDYKKVLLHGKNHDFILKVGDKELRAHQDILRARSHVFESMLNHDMKEKNSGSIDVPDCDPRAMEQFLSYVYCGKVEALDENIMCELYYIADKYDMKSLKMECCDFIKNSLSFSNVCEIIKLALNHSDSGLLEYAEEYFMENASDIVRTVEWQCFLKDNPTVGNELFIKSFEKLKK